MQSQLMGDDANEPTTQVVLPPQVGGGRLRPAVTVSTPTASAPGSGDATPPPGATRITSVKATIESLLGRKRSFSDLQRPKREDILAPAEPALGGLLGGGSAKITPTARPPVAGEREFVQ